MSTAIKKPAAKPLPPLSLVEIITRADAATIQAALEARQKIDALLAERAAAYERIAALEKQVDEVMGEPGLFVFPAPTVAVAPFTAPAPTPAAPAASAAPAADPAAPAADHAASSPASPASKKGGAPSNSGKSGN
jgi:hypothetical protein